jgi:D-amino-acid dehydrogenase
VLDAAGARELEPAVSPAVAGAAYYPDEAHCDPLRFVNAVGRAAAEAGATIRTGVDVVGFGRSCGRIERVHTTAGAETAGTVIVAAGAWTPAVVRELGVFVPVEGGKGYHVELDPDAAPRIPLFLQESRVIATPLEGRLRLAGTLELAGLDLSVDRVRVAALLKAARRNMAGFDAPPVRAVWRGLRPCAPDGLPIVGRAPGYSNLVLATGHAMMGLTLAPVTGRILGDLVLGRSPRDDAAALAPDRFRSLVPLPAR